MAEFVADSGNEPVLGSARLVARDNMLVGTATNRAVSAQFRIGARVEQPGEVLLGPAKLKDVGYAESVIGLEAAPPKLTIRDGGFKLQVPVRAAEGLFPEVPWFDGEGAEVDAKALKKKLGPVLSVVSTRPEAIDLTGVVRVAFVRTDNVQMVLFSGTDKNTVVTTLLRCSVPASIIGAAQVRDVIVPAASLDSVLRHLPSEGKVLLGVQGQRGALQVSDNVSRTFTITPSEVRFPDLRGFEAAQKFATKGTVATGDWIARMKKIKGALKEDKKAEVAHNLTFVPGTAAPVTPGQLKWALRDHSGEVSGEDEFPVAYDGPTPLRLCVGHKYLSSILASLDELGVANVDFHLGEPDASAGPGGAVTTKPVKIVPAGDPEIQFLVALVKPDAV
jgi:hypothetical protein